MAKGKFSYRAVSPFTGKVYTRSSNRVYGFAGIVATTAGQMIASKVNSVQYLEELAKRYSEIAEALSSETGEPPVGGAAHMKVEGSSIAEERAGVRTHWQAALYELKAGGVYEWMGEVGPMSRALLAKRYAGYVASNAAQMQKTNEEIYELEAMSPTAVVSEGASFSSAAHLAEKANEQSAGLLKAVVPVEVVS